MIIPLDLECGSCRKPNHVEMPLNGRLPPYKCSCGYNNVGFLENSFSVGFQIMHRVDYEILDRKDFSLAIVLAAMALDCELARYHRKWAGIESLRTGTDISDEQLDALLRKYNSVDKKIEYVTGLMVPGGMDAFINNNPDLSAQLAKNFPSLKDRPIAVAFQRSLFWPRNAILHLGRTGHTKDDATRLRNISAIGIHMLQAMDKIKRAQPV